MNLVDPRTVLAQYDTAVADMSRARSSGPKTRARSRAVALEAEIIARMRGDLVGAEIARAKYEGRDELDPANYAAHIRVYNVVERHAGKVDRYNAIEPGLRLEYTVAGNRFAIENERSCMLIRGLDSALSIEPSAANTVIVKGRPL